MIAGQVPVGGLTPHRDGYVTSRGTFQKYFQHDELRLLISYTLGTETVAAAPGIFFSFRNEEELAEYQLARRSWRRVSTAGFASCRDRVAGWSSRPDAAERVRSEVGVLAELFLERGGPPQVDELPATLLDRLAEQRVSLGQALDIASSKIGEEEFADARDRRREDLIVHCALSMLNRGQESNSPGIRRDIRALFGNQGELAAQAKDYLFGLADNGRMRSAIDKAVDAKMGVKDERDRFVFAPDTLNNLPGALRCFVGCVTHLSGEPTSDFVYRLDPTRRRATLIMLDDAEDELPTSTHEVRIDLARQHVFVVAKRRRLLRKADLERHGPRSKQRRAELGYSEINVLPDGAVFETIP